MVGTGFRPRIAFAYEILSLIKSQNFFIVLLPDGEQHSMTADEFRISIERIGLTQSSLARRMQALGDPRTFPTILRSISNQVRGVSAVSGEMCVVMNLLAQAHVPAQQE
jgi:hypothetical protein